MKGFISFLCTNGIPQLFQNDQGNSVLSGDLIQKVTSVLLQRSKLEDSMHGIASVSGVARGSKREDVAWFSEKTPEARPY